MRVGYLTDKHVEALVKRLPMIGEAIDKMGWHESAHHVGLAAHVIASLHEKRRKLDEERAAEGRCQECGATDAEECALHSDQDCWREFHGGKRSATTERLTAVQRSIIDGTFGVRSESPTASSTPLAEGSFRPLYALTATGESKIESSPEVTDDGVNRKALQAAYAAYDDSLECQPRENTQAVYEAVAAYVAALSVGREGAETKCQDCGRHVLSQDKPATGWLAACGRRLSRIDECGKEPRCTTDSYGETVLPTNHEPVPSSKGREGAAQGRDAVRVKALVEVLEWYGEQARLCRLIHSEGDSGRHALSADGGKRAKAALAALDTSPEGMVEERI